MKTNKIWDPYKDFQQTILPNGLAVHSAFWDRQCVHVRIVVHSGSTCDPRGKEGLAHFAEHMLNSENEKNAKVIEKLGGSVRFGSTNNFVTHFSFTVPMYNGAIVKTLKIFEKMLGQVPTGNFLEKERRVILQEFYREFPVMILNELKYMVFKKTYQRTSFENFMGGLGVPDTINAISINDVQEFFIEHYVPSNISIVVVGGIKHGEVVKYIQDNFSLQAMQGKKRMICSNLPELDFPKSKQKIVSLAELFDGLKVENTTLHSYAVVPGCFSYEVLRICRSSLRKVLMHEIREKKQLTYDVSVFCSIIGGCYDLEIETMFNPGNLKTVKAIINSSFEKIRSKKHFERSKNALIMEYATVDPNMQQLCDSAQDDLTHFGRIRSIIEEKSNLQSISFERYCELVDYLADPKRWWTLIMTP